MTYVDVVGYAAAVAVAATYWMRTMIPLRTIGIVSNVLFIAYGVLDHSAPVLILHSLMLPLNSWRLYQMLRLVRRVRDAAQGDLSLDWLKPLMTGRACRGGEVLFHAGDKADAMYYTVSGRFKLSEIGLEIGAGQIIGELGLVTPENRRTLSLECVESGEVLRIGYEEVRQLYFQNPRFGYYLLRLVSDRLMAYASSVSMELDEPLPAMPAAPERERAEALAPMT